MQYEIEQAWKMGKGIVGIYIHKIKNSNGDQSCQGKNPFDDFFIDKTMNYIDHRSAPLDSNEIRLSSVVETYDSPYYSSEYVYNDIKENIDFLIEQAIKIRNRYPK